MGMSDAQFKDSLRKDLQTFERLKKLVNKLEESDIKAELSQELDGEIKRISSSLQD